MNPNSETHNRASSRSKQAPRRINRSRKGCPECRMRKIKCDEKKPECTQCRNKGRACGIIDGLFRPVSFTPETTFVSSPAAEVSEIDSSHPWPDSPAGNDSSAETRGPLTQTIKSTSIINPSKKYSQTTAISPRSPTQPRHSTPPESQFPLPSNPQRAIKRASTRSQRSLYSQSSPIVPNSNKIGARHALTHKSTFPEYFLEENNQNRIEISFFLRHFAEGSGKWMDIFTNNRSYFSQHVVQLASQSQLFRYSACAIAAKQLGQMKDSTKVTNNTPQSKITASKLLEVESNIHFTWYGAKYYEKAILLMAQQISQTPNSTSHLSPSDIYQSTGNDADDDADGLGDHGYASSLFRALSACILCAYEDLNATMRAWSGHLDGAIKLIGPLIFLPAIYPDTCGAPQASRALETAFWYSALDDMLNSCACSKVSLLMNYANINSSDLKEKVPPTP
ncbi:hypothetical protein N7456_008746 [Penicillium angulare]|uniref:Zn(2)-C6 fungal-type domain-containing protein n=1 Tax=Penicillium angulare TaxID=116970 RepID=A0A9W9F3D5_9EURO|nr:hypothetical protein N7456_008746 [Penicillium angulare]